MHYRRLKCHDAINIHNKNMVGNNPNSLTVASPISRLSNIPTDKAPKFIRSKDRCHIIVRTPIYDAKGNLFGL